MIRTFTDLFSLAGTHNAVRAAAACAADREVLAALRSAIDLGIATAVLTGDRRAILHESEEASIPTDGMEIIDIPDPVEACRAAARLTGRGEADVLMKGLIDTSVLLKAVLDPENGLRTGAILSHVGLFRVPGWDRFFFVTDAAMNIAPDLETKAAIIRNAVAAAHALGIPEPKAAVLCAKEKPDPKMPATLDAEALVRMNRNGEIAGCVVGGPLAPDNAVSPEAARHKGIDDPVAGRADILLVPDIESGNILYKSMVFFARAETAGVLMGARVPVVLTSRADSSEAKLNSIALAAAVANADKNPAARSAGTTGGR